MNENTKNLLKNQAEEYLRILESRLGPRDARFEFTGIVCAPPTEDICCPRFSGDHQVNIQITRGSARRTDEGNFAAAKWEIAHECVHLLDPVFPCHWSKTKFIEEGLACWFQDEPLFHPEDVKTLIQCRKSEPSSNVDQVYVKAKAGFLDCYPQILVVIKQLRVLNRTISSIAVQELQEALQVLGKVVDYSTLKFLCTTWKEHGK